MFSIKTKHYALDITTGNYSENTIRHLYHRVMSVEHRGKLIFVPPSSTAITHKLRIIFRIEVRLGHAIFI